jgi:hypothetical protein
MAERRPNKAPPKDMTSIAPAKGAATLGPEIRDRIARDLRNMWDEVVKEGVPAHFADLLDRLAQQEERAGETATSPAADPTNKGRPDEDESKGPR